MTVAQFWAGGSSEIRVTRRLLGSTWSGRGGSGFGKISGSNWWDAIFRTESEERPTLALDYLGNQYAVDTGNGLKETTFPELHDYTGDSLATQLDDAGLVVFKPHNFILQSEAMNTTWTQDNVTIGVNAILAPDGEQTADKLIESVGTSEHRVYTIYAPAGTGEGRQCSVYLKAGERNWFFVATFGSSAVGVYFDITPGAGAVGQESAGFTGTIEDVGDDWFLCSITTTTTVSTNALRIVLAASDGVRSYNGDGASGAYVWGAQLNFVPMAPALDTVDAGYVPTTTAVVYQHRIEPTGLLVESAATNGLLQSNSFLEPTWTKISLDIPTPATTGPDGVSNSGWLLQDSSVGGGAGPVRIAQGVTLLIDTVYTVSAFYKADQLSMAILRITGFTTPGTTNAWFDLTGSGDALTKDAGFTDSGVVDYGNGWIRCWASFLMGGVDTTGNIHLQLAETDGNTNAPRNGTSSIFVSDVQLELGGLSSYIPTVATAVTRLADVVTVATSDYGFVEATGAFVVSADSFGFTAATHVFELGTNTNSQTILFTSDSKINYLCKDGNNVRCNITGGSVSSEVPFKAGIAWALDDYEVFLDGASVNSVTGSGTPPAAADMADLHIGHESGPADYINGHIASLAYYPSRLSVADMNGLTA